CSFEPVSPYFWARVQCPNAGELRDPAALMNRRSALEWRSGAGGGPPRFGSAALFRFQGRCSLGFLRLSIACLGVSPDGASVRHRDGALKQRRILVTGAAGFIGFHTCSRLIAAGARVLGLDDLNTYYDLTLKQARLARLDGGAGFAFERCDVADQQRVSALMATFKPDYVVHLAAQAGV